MAANIGTSTAVCRESSGYLGAPQFRFPCTIAQQALWYLERLEPGNPAWNIAVRFSITGPLNPGILGRAVNEIARRHEILRTTFSVVHGEPMQTVHSSAAIPLPIEDLSHFPQPRRDFEEEQQSISEARRPFNLRSGPLLRVRLLRLADSQHLFLATMHHVVSDGWSVGVFSDEIGSLYADFSNEVSPSLPPLGLQYADYAVWQRKAYSPESLDGHRVYWQEKLAGLPVCEIPTDFPRPTAGTHQSYILSELLSPALSDALAVLGSRHGCTMYTVCLAALKMLIARYARHHDIGVGSLLAGRDRIEVEPLIGLFINTVVLRTDLSGDPSFSELLARVRHTVNDAIAHQDLHFQQVVEAVRPHRHPGRPTLYSINFIYQRDFVKPLEFAGLSMSPIPSKSPGAIHDLNFFMVRRSDGWRLSCEYNCDLYEPETVSRLLGQFRSLLQQAVSDPTRTLSRFTYSLDAGQPLPPFVPRRSMPSQAAPQQSERTK